MNVFTTLKSSDNKFYKIRRIFCRHMRSSLIKNRSIDDVARPENTLMLIQEWNEIWKKTRIHTMNNHIICIIMYGWGVSLYIWLMWLWEIASKWIIVCEVAHQFKLSIWFEGHKRIKKMNLFFLALFYLRFNQIQTHLHFTQNRCGYLHFM